MEEQVSGVGADAEFDGEVSGGGAAAPVPDDVSEGPHGADDNGGCGDDRVAGIEAVQYVFEDGDVGIWSFHLNDVVIGAVDEVAVNHGMGVAAVVDIGVHPLGADGVAVGACVTGDAVVAYHDFAPTSFEGDAEAVVVAVVLGDAGVLNEEALGA